MVPGADGRRERGVSHWLRSAAKGELDRGALRRALNRIVERHEALRTRFVVVEGEPEQQISAVEESSFELIEQDLRAYKDAEGELRRISKEDGRTSFDLEHGPLIRGRLIRLADNDYALLLTMHHIVSDGWSLAVLRKELSTLYGTYVRREKDPLPELEIQYADYAVWQRQWIEGEVLRQQADYWKDTLKGAPALLELPTDYPRPAQQDYAGEYIGVVIDESVTAGLKDLSRRQGTTLYMSMLAGWVTVLARLTGQGEVVIGTPSANRGRAEIENLIGFFVNTLVLRVQVSGSWTVKELLGRVKTVVLGAQQHQHLPFEQVVELAQPERSLSHGPIFQVMFAWQNGFEEKLELQGLAIRGLRRSGPGVAKFDLTLSLQEAGGKIVGGIEYATSLFERSTIERYAGYLRTLLAGMVDEEGLVGRLDLLSEREREQVLYEWNETGAEYGDEKCIQEVFEEQAKKNPEALAVVYGEECLTYEELNRRANRLGRYLRDLGIKPDECVGISMERSLEMMVGVLGILKSGGAYVPLDPGYPEERLQYMLRDSGAVALVTQRHLRGRFGEAEEKVAVVEIEERREEVAESNLEVGSVGVSGGNVAYVIYTSGSTGEPKGVAVEHRNAVNFIRWAGEWFGREVLDRTLFSTSLNFDLAVYECFVPLTVGASVKMVGNALDLIRNEVEATVINTVPSAMGSVLAGGKVAKTVRMINLAGEALKSTLVEEIFAKTEVERVCNLYGPTETTTYSTWVAMNRGEEFANHIGRPIANTGIYVLDGDGEPVPVGVVGEIYIGGRGVARGYWNRPELTAERFLPNPYRGEGERMYRTGDLGRWLEDGNVELIGRKDYQVKIRGYRIELGEIEARLREHEEIGDVVVVMREQKGRREAVGGVPHAEEEGGEGWSRWSGGVACVPERKGAGVHGAWGVCRNRGPAADGERQSGPEGIAGTGSRVVWSTWI